MSEEAKFRIDGQWYYRGNRSPSWFYVASRADGSCQDGISERVPSYMSTLLEKIALQQNALETVVAVLDGRQPKDIPGAVMVAKNALKDEDYDWCRCRYGLPGRCSYCDSRLKESCSND